MEGTIDDYYYYKHDPLTWMLNRRTLKEVTNGHGGSCGSGFLDLRMREYIKNKFYHFGSINDSAMEHIMDAFVNVIKVNELLYYPFQSWDDLSWEK